MTTPSERDQPVLGEPEAQAGAGHRRQAEAAEVVRRDPGGQPLRHVDEGAPLDAGEGAAVGAHVIDELLPHVTSSALICATRPQTGSRHAGLASGCLETLELPGYAHLRRRPYS